jgi:hypothetical protein
LSIDIQYTCPTLGYISKVGWQLEPTQFNRY